VELAARPPARFSSLLNAPEITGTENKNQKENPFTQIPLQNLTPNGSGKRPRTNSFRIATAT